MEDGGGLTEQPGGLATLPFPSALHTPTRAHEMASVQIRCAAAISHGGGVRVDLAIPELMLHSGLSIQGERGLRPPSPLILSLCYQKLPFRLDPSKVCPDGLAKARLGKALPYRTGSSALLG